MQRLFLILTPAFLLTFTTASYSQEPQSPALPRPSKARPSPGAKVSQIIGSSEVTILYHRPGVKGRGIWGDLVPYDEFWRAGANEPTLFTFSHDALAEGNKLPAGTYRFVVIPTKGEWTVVFNSETEEWGTAYNSQYDKLRFKVKPETGPHEEWLSYSFVDLSARSATVVLAWEKLRLPFKIEFPAPKR